MDDLRQPTDEPTEADPLISGPISTSTAVRDALTEMFGDAWQEWSDEATGAAAAVLMWLSSNDRLVGGRSAAPTREQVEVGTDWQTRYLIKAGGDERQTWVVETNPDGVFPPPVVCLIRTDDLPEADRG